MNSKAQSILSYLGIFWLVAYFGGKDQRDSLSLYHLKQGLGLFLTGIAFNILASILVTLVTSLAFLAYIVGLILFVFIIFGVVNAINEQRKALPVIGKYFEDQFTFLN